MEGIYCDKCGKLMIENGNTMIGIQFNVSGVRGFSPAFIHRQLGKYAPGNAPVSFSFEICWECMLDAMIGAKRDAS